MLPVQKLRALCCHDAQDADSLDPKTGHKKEGTFYLWCAHQQLNV